MSKLTAGWVDGAESYVVIPIQPCLKVHRVSHDNILSDRMDTCICKRREEQVVSNHQSSFGDRDESGMYIHIGEFWALLDEWDSDIVDNR